VTVSKPARLGTGDEVRIRGVTHTVAALAGGSVHLVDPAGVTSVISLADLFSAPGMAALPSPRRAPLPPQGLIQTVPPALVEKACWWEQHIVEVLTGVSPEADRTVQPRPEFDPAARTLRQREMAKVAELKALGHEVPLSTFQRLRRSYEVEGLWGLVDARVRRWLSAAGTVDGRIVEAVRRAVAEQTDKSTGTIGRLRRRVEKILVAEYGADAPLMPLGGASSPDSEGIQYEEQEAQEPLPASELGREQFAAAGPAPASRRWSRSRSRWRPVPQRRHDGAGAAAGVFQRLERCPVISNQLSFPGVRRWRPHRGQPGNWRTVRESTPDWRGPALRARDTGKGGEADDPKGSPSRRRQEG
jgi:hypothetical protein